MRVNGQVSVRRSMALALIAAMCGGSALLAHRSFEGGAAGASAITYTVLIKDAANRDRALAEIARARGTVVGEQKTIGVVTVTSRNAAFATAMARSTAVLGAAPDRPIGRLRDAERLGRNAPEIGATVGSAALSEGQAAAKTKEPTAGLDPLDANQWGLKMVRADLARTRQAGRKGVLVGILSSGIDATHPDLAPNLDAARAINFVTDIPTDDLGNPFDGPCEYTNCIDPTTIDGQGAGTSEAGIVAAAANGIGLSGVAPNVTMVNVRVIQDSGFVFLQPVINGLVYAADIGVDVVTMGFFIDPWLYNCLNNPADTPEAQAAQRATILAVSRALEYAHSHGVTVIGSLGSRGEDLGAPKPDNVSPNYPLGTSYTRTIDNATCLELPAEGPHVIGVGGVGPSGRKPNFGNYGVERIAVAAPAGYFRDFFGTPAFRTLGNMVLSTYPRSLLLEKGYIDNDNNVTPMGVAFGVQSGCDATRCGFYFPQQNTAYAAAHAAGVAALIVSEWGHSNGRNGRKMDPDDVKRILLGTASKVDCPDPPTVSYLFDGFGAEFDATCTGDQNFNGFYGHGVVDAWAAVTDGKRFMK